MFPFCCCAGYCTTRQYAAAGGWQWSAPGDDSLSSRRNDIAIDDDGNAYAVLSYVEKIGPSGSRLWKTTAPRREVFCVCTDGATYGFFGSLLGPVGETTPLLPGPSVWKFRLSDGVIVNSNLIGNGLTDFKINGCVPDGSGGVVFATTHGLYHLDSDLAQIPTTYECTPVGGGLSANFTAIAKDDSDNLYVIRTTNCAAVPDNGCSAEWNILKYQPDGTLLNGRFLAGASAIAWHAEHVYVGYDGRTESDNFCNLISLNDTSFLRDDQTAKCNWTTRLGKIELGPDDPILGRTKAYDPIVDLAASDDLVYAIAGKYLFAVDAATGDFQWCRKNESVDSSSVAHSGTYSGVAANEDLVWATGKATPCAAGNVEDCDQGACDNQCECVCGGVGRNGGYLVGDDGTSDCHCKEVPCVVTLRQQLTGCFSDWPSTVTMTKDSGHGIWRGSFTWTCASGSYLVTYTATHDCETGWTLVIDIGGLFTITTTITPFCSGLDGHPGFTWTASVDKDDLVAAGITCCDADSTLCGGFGDTGCGVDTCGCTGLPDTVYIHGSSSGPLVLGAFTPEKWGGTVGGHTYEFYCAGSEEEPIWSLTVDGFIPYIDDTPMCSGTLADFGATIFLGPTTVTDAP